MKYYLFLTLTICNFCADGQSMIKEGYVDTIRLIGTCQYLGLTGSIIATTYYRFKVDQVLEGDFEGDSITFESDVNSKNLIFIDQHTKGNEVNIPAEQVFPDCDVPVQKVYQCRSEPIEIQVSKIVEDLSFLNKGIRTKYQKLWVRD